MAGNVIAIVKSMLTLWPSANHISTQACSLQIGKAPSSRSRNRLRGLSLSFLLLLPSSALASSAAGLPERVDPRVTSLSHAERLLGRASAHVAEFAPVSASPLAVPKCASVRQPEALLTPDPLLPPQDDNLLVGVSFIIGPDGHVHSAFVTYSGGTEDDQAVLHAVRGWRYRPALCNGVPTDSEARVRFSVHE
jgi:TonB family protein